MQIMSICNFTKEAHDEGALDLDPAFIKHYTIVVSIITIQFSHLYADVDCVVGYNDNPISKV